MKRMTKLIMAVGCLATLVLAGGFALLIYFGPPGPRLICHKTIAGGFIQWQLATTNGEWYPNVDGNSFKSFAAILPYQSKNYMSEIRDYRYVPGLKSSDPKELIIVYVREPSRRSWNGDTLSHWFRKEKRWIVLNPRWYNGEDDRWSEVAEWIPTEEFTNRLTKTIQFLSENPRDYWTNTVKEHSEFLQSLRK